MAFAVSIAHKTLGELPLPLMAIATSPGSASAASGLRKDHVVAHVVRVSRHRRHIVVEANNFVARLVRLDGALDHIHDKVRGAGGAATVTEDKDVPPFSAGLLEGSDDSSDRFLGDFEKASDSRLIILYIVHPGPSCKNAPPSPCGALIIKRGV
jgi:hypothetical protein